MPKKKKRNVIVVNRKKKKLPIIRTKKGIKVISKNNVIKNKSENWLQKSKLISSILGTSTNPIAKIGSHIAQSYGYGRRRRYGGSMRRITRPSNNTAIIKPSLASRAKTAISKYGKYAIPLAMAAMVASRGTRHHEIPYAGESLRAQYERF